MPVGPWGFLPPRPAGLGKAWSGPPSPAKFRLRCQLLGQDRNQKAVTGRGSRVQLHGRGGEAGRATPRWAASGRSGTDLDSVLEEVPSQQRPGGRVSAGAGSTGQAGTATAGLTLGAKEEVQGTHRPSMAGPLAGSDTDHSHGPTTGLGCHSQPEAQQAAICHGPGVLWEGSMRVQGGVPSPQAGGQLPQRALRMSWAWPRAQGGHGAPGCG